VTAKHDEFLQQLASISRPVGLDGDETLKKVDGNTGKTHNQSITVYDVAAANPPLSANWASVPLQHNML